MNCYIKFHNHIYDKCTIYCFVFFIWEWAQNFWSNVYVQSRIQTGKTTHRNGTQYLKSPLMLCWWMFVLGMVLRSECAHSSIRCGDPAPHRPEPLFPLQWLAHHTSMPPECAVDYLQWEGQDLSLPGTQKHLLILPPMTFRAGKSVEPKLP